MVTSASPLDAQAEPKTLFAALDNNRINRRFHAQPAPCYPILSLRRIPATLLPNSSIPATHPATLALPFISATRSCNPHLTPTQASCATTDLPVRQASTLATTDMTHRPHQVSIGPRHTAADASTATPPPPPLLSAAAQPAVAIPIAAQPAVAVPTAAKPAITVYT